MSLAVTFYTVNIATGGRKPCPNLLCCTKGNDPSPATVLITTVLYNGPLVWAVTCRPKGYDRLLGRAITVDLWVNLQLLQRTIKSASWRPPAVHAFSYLKDCVTNSSNMSNRNNFYRSPLGETDGESMCGSEAREAVGQWGHVPLPTVTEWRQCSQLGPLL